MTEQELIDKYLAQGGDPDYFVVTSDQYDLPDGVTMMIMSKHDFKRNKALAEA